MRFRALQSITASVRTFSGGRIFGVFALLVLVVLPAPARAGCWDHCCDNWSEFQAACRCEGGEPLPNPPRCVGGVSDETPVTPVDPRALQRDRWNLLLQKDLVDSATYAALPIEDAAQFAVALTRIYAELYRSTAIWNAQAADYDARSAVEMAVQEQFYWPKFRTIDVADELDPAVRAENQQAKAKLAELQDELERQNALRERFVRKEKAVLRSEQLRNEVAIATRRRIDYFFGGFSRKEVENTVGAGGPTPTKESCCEESEFPIPMNWYQLPPIPIKEQLAANEAQKALAAAQSAAAPTLYGDVETRLQAAEEQARAAEAARSAFAWSRDHYQHDVHDGFTVPNKQIWGGIVAKNVEVLKETHRLVNQEIPELEVEVKWAKEVFKADVWGFYMAGGADAAWTFFNKYVVEPEIKRVAIELNHPEKYSLTDAEVEHAWKLDQHAIFGAYSGYKKGKNAYALIQQAKNLEWHAEASALAVADVMGRADLGDYQAVGDQLFGGLDTAARAEVREVLGQVKLPFAFKKFWEAYFTGVEPAFEEGPD